MVQQLMPELHPIAERLTRQMESSGTASLEDLLAYATVLYNSDVYSERQRYLIGKALAIGVPAKGVGSLYNGSVVLMGDIDVSKHLALSLPGVSIFGSIQN
jgi:hypothetical protein